MINDGVGPALEEFVTDFCDLFPWPVSSHSQNFNNQYLDEIIADLEAGIEDISVTDWTLCYTASP
jgi:hypothetical protein